MTQSRRRTPEHPEHKRSVLQALRDIVALKSITAAAIARLTGMVQPNVSRMLSERSTTKWSQILEILPSLGVNVKIVLRDSHEAKGKLSVSNEVRSDTHPDLIEEKPDKRLA